MFIDLNTTTKEELADFLLCEDDAEEFYYPREEQILNLDFDLETMIEEFESWLVENCDC